MDALLSVPGLWRLEREVVDRVIRAGLGESARGLLLRRGGWREDRGG